jgi:hypothetical protein
MCFNGVHFRDYYGPQISLIQVAEATMREISRWL